MTILDQILDQTGWILADGATGTNFFKQGLETGYPPELWNVERPNEVSALHAAFIDAGSQLILTNSFDGTAHRLKLHKAKDRVGQLNSAGGEDPRTLHVSWLVDEAEPRPRPCTGGGLLRRCS